MPCLGRKFLLLFSIWWLVPCSIVICYAPIGPHEVVDIHQHALQQNGAGTFLSLVPTYLNMMLA
jgi:hypothetical protein